jgi:hypothetical protein
MSQRKKILRFPGGHLDTLPDFKALDGLDLDVLETALKMLVYQAELDLAASTIKVDKNEMTARATAVAHIDKIQKSLHAYDLIKAQLGAVQELRGKIPDEPQPA